MRVERLKGVASELKFPPREVFGGTKQSGNLKAAYVYGSPWPGQGEAMKRHAVIVRVIERAMRVAKILIDPV
jgi:hypothetical protein